MAPSPLPTLLWGWLALRIGHLRLSQFTSVLVIMIVMSRCQIQWKMRCHRTSPPFAPTPSWMPSRLGQQYPAGQVLRPSVDGVWSWLFFTNVLGQFCRPWLGRKIQMSPQGNCRWTTMPETQDSGFDEFNLSWFQVQLSHVRGRVSAGVSFGQIAESSLNYHLYQWFGSYNFIYLRTSCGLKEKVNFRVGFLGPSHLTTFISHFFPVPPRRPGASIWFSCVASTADHTPAAACQMAQDSVEHILWQPMFNSIDSWSWRL